MAVSGIHGAEHGHEVDISLSIHVLHPKVTSISRCGHTSCSYTYPEQRSLSLLEETGHRLKPAGRVSSFQIQELLDTGSQGQVGFVAI